MCTINMTGKTKIYIDIHITKTSLMKRLIFDNEEEKDSCSKYLDLKGVAYHVLLINFIGLNKDGKIKYKTVKDVYKYDKRIRNRLYKFISAFEEQMRAFIANSHNHGLESLNLGKKIKENLNQGSNIARELEELEFGKLLQIIKRFTKKDLKRLFPSSDEHIHQNLKAIRELRNAISHHRILLLYEDYEICYINGAEKKDLKSNIINLINLIDIHYKNYLIAAINDAINDKRDEEFSVLKRFAIKIENESASKVMERAS